MRRIAVCISFIGVLTHFVYAVPHVTRNYVSRYYTTRDGLVQMQVGCIYQDRDGYMWFGTKYGASRFDGVAFKSYTVKNGMPIGEVGSIGEWDDKIVMTTVGKLVIIFPNDSIACYKLPDIGVSAGSYPTLKMFDKNHLLIFNSMIHDSINHKPLTNDRHYIFSLKDKKFRPLNFTHQTVTYMDSDYLITHDYIYKIGKGFVLKPIVKIPFDYKYLDADMKKGILYFKGVNVDFHGSLTNIYKYKFEHNQLQFEKKIMWSKSDGSNSTCLLNDGTLVFFNENWKANFYPNRDVSFGNDLTIVNDVFVDREGNLWVGTDCGVYNYYNLNIEEYKFNLAKSDNIWSITEDKNYNMWFGSYGSGLWRLDKTNKLKPMNRSISDWRLQYMGSVKTKSGTLYFPASRGVSKYENNRFTYSGETGACTSIFYSEENKKLYHSGFNPKNGQSNEGVWYGFGNQKRFFPVKKGLPRTIKQDKSGRILLGSARGLSYLIGDSVLMEDTRKHSYRGIISMSIDQIGRIWKGTENGVYVELPNGSEFRIAINRIADPIYSIMVYHNKYLLAGGIRCLFIVNLEQLKSYTNPEMWEIGYDAGFTGLESGQNGFCEDHNGDVWLTTALSVLKFNPEKLVQSQKQITPPIRLAKLYYSIDNLNWKQLVFGNKSIEISPSDKFLRFEYVANSISAPKSLRFRYRLKGFSDEWSEPIYNKTVDFTNVNYGKYQFEVQCSMDGAHWSQTARSPLIEIETPFWSSTVAYILYLVLFSSLVTGITFLVLRQKNKKKIDLLNKQKYENQLQLNTLRSKVIPHFTKNVLSAIGNFAMTNRLKASYYISVFSNFTQLTLSNADKNYISIKEELDYIRTYLELEKMRFGKRFDYKIESEEEVPLNLLIPTMTLHTYCDNAIRHGLVNKSGNGLLVVRISKNSSGVFFEIIDNGIGRQRAKELGTQGNGQGLLLIQSQLDFYNQSNNQFIMQTITDLIDNQGNSAGTKVELLIPNDYKFTIE